MNHPSDTALLDAIKEEREFQLQLRDGKVRDLLPGIFAEALPRLDEDTLKYFATMMHARLMLLKRNLPATKSTFRALKETAAILRTQEEISDRTEPTGPR